MIFFLIAPLLTSIIMRTFGWRVLLARKGLISTWLLDLGVIEAPLDLVNQPVAVYLHEHLLQVRFSFNAAECSIGKAGMLVEVVVPG